MDRVKARNLYKLLAFSQEYRDSCYAYSRSSVIAFRLWHLLCRSGTMGPVDIYAMVVIGTFALMMGRRLVEAVPPLLESLRMVVDKHLRIPYAVEPNRWMDGRTRLAILRQTAMMAISLCAIFLRMGDTGDLIKRTG